MKEARYAGRVGGLRHKHAEPPLHFNYRSVEGEMLWDGGLGCSAPIEQWIDDPDVTHIVEHSTLYHVHVRARERSDRYNFISAMLVGHQLTADELLHWKLELARRAGKTDIAVGKLITNSFGQFVSPSDSRAKSRSIKRRRTP